MSRAGFEWLREPGGVCRIRARHAGTRGSRDVLARTARLRVRGFGARCCGGGGTNSRGVSEAEVALDSAGRYVSGRAGTSGTSGKGMDGGEAVPLYARDASGTRAARTSAHLPARAGRLLATAKILSSLDRPASEPERIGDY